MRWWTCLIRVTARIPLALFALLVLLRSDGLRCGRLRFLLWLARGGLRRRRPLHRSLEAMSGARWLEVSAEIE